VDSGVVGYKSKHNLATVLGDMGDIEGAKRQWRRVLEEKPEYKNGWQTYCCFLFERQEFVEAERTLRELLCRWPDDPAARHNLGTTLLCLGMQDEAVAELRRSCLLRPNYPSTWLQLGRALVAARRHSEAVAAWSEGLRLNPDDASLSDVLAATSRGEFN
jgi:predicted Zn-dependent protease